MRPPEFWDQVIGQAYDAYRGRQQDELDRAEATVREVFGDEHVERVEDGGEGGPFFLARRENNAGLASTQAARKGVDG